MEPIIDQLRTLIADNYHKCQRAAGLTDPSENVWLRDTHLEIYVRICPTYLQRGVKEKNLQLANINATAPGKGHFTAFLEQAERMSPYSAIFIENVLTPRLCAFFERRGYVKWTEVETILPCYVFRRTWTKRQRVKLGVIGKIKGVFSKSYHEREGTVMHSPRQRAGGLIKHVSVRFDGMQGSCYQIHPEYLEQLPWSPVGEAAANVHFAGH